MTVISRPLFTRPVLVASYRVARAAVVGALVGAVVIGTAVSASAHVGVHPAVTTAGQGAQLTFRVSDESDTANTIKLVLAIPQDRPFTDVSTHPMPGWTATVTDTPLPIPVNVGGASITKAPHTVRPADSTHALGASAPAATTTTTGNAVRVLGGLALLAAVVSGGLVLLRRHPKADSE